MTAVLSAVFSSVLTVWLAWFFFRRYLRVQLERRLQDYHEDMGRIVENRVRKAVAESLNDANSAEVLRDKTWQVARTGADIVNDGISALLGRRRKDGPGL